MWQRGALPWRLQSGTLDSAGGHTMLLPPSSLQLCLCTGLRTVYTGRHSHLQGCLAGRTGSWSLTRSRSPLRSLGPNSVLTLRAVAPPGCFPLSASFIFKQRRHDSKLHSFSVSNHSFNLFKRTADLATEAGFAYSNFRDRVSEVYPTDH